MADEPKTPAELWSEWLREASVLIAVFGGVLYPLFDESKVTLPEWVPQPLVDAHSHPTGWTWFLGMILLAGLFMWGGMKIERGRK